MTRSIPKLPPLNALRAFEAAARHRSFTRAAAELNVTQAAVSAQVKLLEERLGLRLFLRSGGGLKLTPEAEGYFSAVREGFALMSDATEKLMRCASGANLTVSCLPNFAMRWLLPRLHLFNQQHPDINLNVLTASRSDDFDHEQMDVAIRWGCHWPRLQTHYLLSAEMTPVCSPVLQDACGLRSPGDLGKTTLLHIQGTMEDWQLWLDHAGVDNVDPTAGPRFDSLAFALQAAADGMGVALARLPLVRDDLALGRLIEPFDLRYVPPKAWHLLYPSTLAGSAKVRAFTEWILGQARASPYHRPSPPGGPDPCA